MARASRPYPDNLCTPFLGGRLPPLIPRTKTPIIVILYILVGSSSVYRFSGPLPCCSRKCWPEPTKRLCGANRGLEGLSVRGSDPVGDYLRKCLTNIRKSNMIMARALLVKEMASAVWWLPMSFVFLSLACGQSRSIRGSRANWWETIGEMA